MGERRDSEKGLFLQLNDNTGCFNNTWEGEGRVAEKGPFRNVLSTGCFTKAKKHMKENKDS